MVNIYLTKRKLIRKKWHWHKRDDYINIVAIEEMVYLLQNVDYGIKRNSVFGMILLIYHTFEA